MISSKDISENEYNPSYQPYINTLKVPELFGALNKSYEDTLTLLENLTEDKLLYRYGEDKWTIKEIVQHLIDAERILCYRALRFSRNDSTDLPGYDENWFVNFSNANERPITDLLAEFHCVRSATVSLFKSFTEEMLIRTGVANTSEMSVRAAGLIIAGHQWHHLNVIKERYLSTIKKL
ncbi:MAG: DinB family protein [Flavobacteriaceae bacterium]|nr:DinB family protein [Flavobacteriaceae bacterium]